MTQSFAFPTMLYLQPGELQGLSDVAIDPGAPQDGYPLVWDNDLGKWVISTLPYSSIDGAPALPIPLASGGTGTQTGSITGTGELTFASASNGNVTLSPQGTGKAVIGNELDINLRSQNSVLTGLNINLPNNEANLNNGLYFRKGSGSFSVSNGTSTADAFLPFFVAINNPSQTNQGSGLGFIGRYPPVNPITQASNAPSLGVVNFNARDTDNTSTLLPDSLLCFAFWNSSQQVGVLTSPSLLFSILGSGNAGLKGELNIRSTSASTNTTTGALRVAGGIGAQGNLNVAGTKINFANLPTSSTGLAVGDLWRDGDVVKVKL